MRQIFIRFKYLAFIVISLSVLASCGKKPEEQLIGTWFYEALDFEGYKFQVEFKEVGVGNYKMEKDGKTDVWNMKYIISGKENGYPVGTYTLLVPFENQNFELKGNFKMVNDNSMIFGVTGREADKLSEVMLKRK